MGGEGWAEEVLAPMGFTRVSIVSELSWLFPVCLSLSRSLF